MESSVSLERLSDDPQILQHQLLLLSDMEDESPDEARVVAQELGISLRTVGHLLRVILTRPKSQKTKQSSKEPANVLPFNDTVLPLRNFPLIDYAFVHALPANVRALVRAAVLKQLGTDTLPHTAVDPKVLDNHSIEYLRPYWSRHTKINLKRKIGHIKKVHLFRTHREIPEVATLAMYKNTNASLSNNPEYLQRNSATVLQRTPLHAVDPEDTLKMCHDYQLSECSVEQEPLFEGSREYSFTPNAMAHALVGIAEDMDGYKREFLPGKIRASDNLAKLDGHIVHKELLPLVPSSYDINAMATSGDLDTLFRERHLQNSLFERADYL